MYAGVFLIVALLDTEWDEAAAQPEAEDTDGDAQDPGETTLALQNLSHAAAAAVMAVDDNRVAGPVILFEGLLSLLLSHARKRLHHDHRGP